jgi:hypothetical protein
LPLALVRPFASDEIAVPTEYCLRRHREAPPPVARQDPTYCRQQNPVSLPKARTPISAKYMQLMAENQYLEVAGSIIWITASS